MKKLLVILTMLLCCSAFEVKAQTYIVATSDTSPSSTKISNVRYEFVQYSSMSLLIDKYTGDVWRYRNKKKGFETIVRENPDSVDVNRENYQLYISSEFTYMCFLLNVHTGEMWRYSSAEGAEKRFVKIEMPWEAKKEENNFIKEYYE